MALLVDLTKYKAAVGETSAANDTLHTEAIEDASAAILNWTDRDFGAAEVTETREYLYDGSGVLEIDDCTAITNVAVSGGNLGSSTWTARREGPPGVLVYSYLEFPTLQTSRAMGFTRNEDTLLAAAAHGDATVSVTATFGWPVVPDDVQRAAIWTAAWMEADSGGAAAGLAAKSVAEIAETYIAQQEANDRPTDEPVPRRAQALLAGYRKRRVG